MQINIIEIPLTSKNPNKMTPPNKIFLHRCVELGASFHGRNKSSRFFFNNPEISAQIQKPTDTSLLWWLLLNIYIDMTVCNQTLNLLVPTADRGKKLTQIFIFSLLCWAHKVLQRFLRLWLNTFWDTTNKCENKI